MFLHAVVSDITEWTSLFSNGIVRYMLVSNHNTRAPAVHYRENDKSVNVFSTTPMPMTIDYTYASSIHRKLMFIFTQACYMDFDHMAFEISQS